MKYKVKQEGKHWVVITPDNRIANDHKHDTEAKAKRHCAYLIAFFG